ncbi:hypothetical protein GCM10027043_30660 [Ferruginibacter profundus]
MVMAVMTGEEMMTEGMIMTMTDGATKTPLDSAYKNKAPEIFGALVIYEFSKTGSSPVSQTMS